LRTLSWQDGDAVPSKILIVRLGAIGDVVNALVFATALKRAFPDVHIGWAVHVLSEPLVRDHPMVDHVHLWRRERGVAGFFEVLRDVRAEGYELAVDLQRIFKSGALARLSGARRVVGYDRARSKEASYWWSKEHIPAGDPGAHMIEQYLEVARYLGVSEPQAEHLLPTDAAADAWAQQLVQELGEAPLLINIGASKPENRWPTENFGQLAQRCIDELDLHVCFTGGPDDRPEAARAVEVAQRPARLTNLVGETSLRELAALQSRARLFVGCDTGPMHLAAASGVPVVALFGPADPRRTGPWGARHRVVGPGAKAASGTTRIATRAMRDIGVQDVFEFVDTSLRDDPITPRR